MPSKSHSVSIDTFYNDIVNACIEAGQCTLPHKVNVQKKYQVGVNMLSHLKKKHCPGIIYEQIMVRLGLDLLLK